MEHGACVRSYNVRLTTTRLNAAESSELCLRHAACRKRLETSFMLAPPLCPPRSHCHLQARAHRHLLRRFPILVLYLCTALERRAPLPRSPRTPLLYLKIPSRSPPVWSPPRRLRPLQIFPLRQTSPLRQAPLPCPGAGSSLRQAVRRRRRRWSRKGRRRGRRRGQRVAWGGWRGG